MNRTGWFIESQIERTVTRTFVCSHLVPEDIADLDRPAFGSGLSNDSYWDIIETKARRLFLILVDVGLPDQIFGVIADGWEDADLPLPLNQVCRLALTEERNAKLDAKFYDRQFYYLVRTVEAGLHVDYASDELVPLDVVDRRAAGDTHQDTVKLPNHPERNFSRRGVQLGQHMSEEAFKTEISLIKNLQHDHIESYFASYTHDGHGYVLFTPASEYKLAAYLTTTPASLKALDKLAQRLLVLDWIHCLVSTLSAIHLRGGALGSIKPSTVLATHDHRILLPDRTCFNPETHTATKSFSRESYDYAAPEQCPRPATLPPTIRATTHRNWTLSSKSSSSPDATYFSISRGGPSHPQPAHHQQPPAINPLQPADVFSLGCVLLSLISHGLLNRSPAAFATVRAAKHKNPGRGGAVLDASFHRNLGQVEVWMAALAKDAAKKASSSSSKQKSLAKVRTYRAVIPLLHVVERMLAQQPGDRPSAKDVQGLVCRIIVDIGGVAAPHCVGTCWGSSGSGTASSSSSSGGAVNYKLPSPRTTLFETPSPWPPHNEAGTRSLCYRPSSSTLTLGSKRSSVFSIQTLGRHHGWNGSDNGSFTGTTAVNSSIAGSPPPSEYRWGSSSGPVKKTLGLGKPKRNRQLGNSEGA